jgi:hypothetical protein
MLDGLDHVWKAAQILVGDGSLKERLKRAGPEFIVSTVQQDQWPDDLKEAALNLRARFVQDIDSLDPRKAEQLAHDLLDLAGDVLCEFRRDT